MSDKDYNVSIRYTFGDLGGKGEHTSRVSYETVQLMMKAPFVTIDGKTIKVNSVEVTDMDSVNFYGDEIPRLKQKEERTEEDWEAIKKWL